MEDLLRVVRQTRPRKQRDKFYKEYRGSDERVSRVELSSIIRGC